VRLLRQVRLLLRPDELAGRLGLLHDEAGGSPPDTGETRCLEEMAASGLTTSLCGSSGLYQVTDDGRSRYQAMDSRAARR
jgi:hypothetical protein